MKKIIALILILNTLVGLGQNGDALRLKNEVLDLEYNSGELYPENHIGKFVKYDFSGLLFPRNEFLGFIGDDYQRIEMYYSSICKSEHHEIYNVKGVSVVKNNKCDFTGTIKVMSILEFKDLHYGADMKYKDDEIKHQGVLIADYHFKEDPEQNHVGEFIGTMYLLWYIDRNGVLHYDNIEHYSDGYKNNQYAGVWRSYKTLKSRRCNWGVHRIPFVGDLDVGTGEFSPNKKYHDKGWGNY